jgi:hypothetical protein
MPGELLIGHFAFFPMLGREFALAFNDLVLFVAHRQTPGLDFAT